MSLLLAAYVGALASLRLDTSINLHARLMAAERKVAPCDVLEHVREVVDHGGAGRAPPLPLARLLIGRGAEVSFPSRDAPMRGFGAWMR